MLYLTYGPPNSRYPTHIPYYSRAMLIILISQSPQDDPVNQAIKELKDQLSQITQSNTDMRDALTAITNANSQQQQVHQLVQQQVQQQLQQRSSTTTASQWNHDYDVLQPPPVLDERDKENAELKAQLAALKATLIARQNATAVPSYPNSSHSLNWSPGDQASAIPSWQQKGINTSSNNSSPNFRTMNSSPTPGHQPQIQPLNLLHQPTPHTPPQNRTLQPSTPQTPSTPQQQAQQQQQQTTPTPQQIQQQQQAETSAPYSSAFNDVLQLVQDKNLPKEELHRRLNIREINDKPVGTLSFYFFKSPPLLFCLSRKNCNKCKKRVLKTRFAINLWVCDCAKKFAIDAFFANFAK
jgi:hypothetical protein